MKGRRGESLRGGRPPRRGALPVWLVRRSGGVGVVAGVGVARKARAESSSSLVARSAASLAASDSLIAGARVLGPFLGGDEGARRLRRLERRRRRGRAREPLLPLPHLLLLLLLLPLRFHLRRVSDGEPREHLRDLGGGDVDPAIRGAGAWRSVGRSFFFLQERG